MSLSRRSFLPLLIAAPAIVRASSLMPVRSWQQGYSLYDYDILSSIYRATPAPRMTLNCGNLWNGATVEITGMGEYVAHGAGPEFVLLPVIAPPSTSPETAVE